MKTRAVVINRCFGGFGLSHEATMLYSELAKLNLKPVEGKYFSFTGYDYYIDGIETDEMFWYDNMLKRDDPDLVSVVRKLGEKANGPHADLKVVEIPYDIEWEIDEYDGSEQVAEKHRTWS
jgi:hypothetical protein